MDKMDKIDSHQLTDAIIITMQTSTERVLLLALVPELSLLILGRAGASCMIVVNQIEQNFQNN
jgi:hypothetical protein